MHGGLEYYAEYFDRVQKFKLWKYYAIKRYSFSAFNYVENLKYPPPWDHWCY